MNSTTTLERVALREKLLTILRKGVPEAIIDDIKWLIHESGNGAKIAGKVDKILDETKQDELLYSYVEWFAAYIIAHEQKTLEELIEIHESSIIKYRHNRKLSEHIRNMIWSLNGITNEFVAQIKEIRNENVFDDVLRSLERTNSVTKYLVNTLDEIEKENKKLLETLEAARENIRKTIGGILENL